jgi:hypothetical protein
MTDEEFEEFAAVAAAYGTKHTTQEPVAWISSWELGKVARAQPTIKEGEDDEDHEGVAPGQQLTSVTLSTKKHSYYGEIPLYTASKREWVGLTDKERYLDDERTPEEIEYAKAIEAKLREKNI